MHSGILNSSLVAQRTTADDDGSSMSMEDLYSALAQCFGIIVCGYVAGLLKIISNAETKGLNTFVGTFALPSLICLSLVELNWQQVNWKFLAAMLIAKAIVFFFVCIISVLVTKPLNYGRGGILATFCTQSNDFAIGYPIVIALYQKVHPEYASYLYLMVPISLVILNPIGYVMMEISNLKKRNQNSLIDSTERPPCSPPIAELSTERHSSFKNKYVLILKIVWSIFFNPILVMTILGIIGGVAFPNRLPNIVLVVLRAFGNSFSATTLFLLGLRMLGTARGLQGSSFLAPGLLILVKLLVLPLVNRQTVIIMNAGANISDTTDLSTFGFLYGTIPTAPGVFVVATRYQTDVDLITNSMVACTFISAPLMFISAKMISLTKLNPADYLNKLDEFAFEVSIAGTIACCWILLLFGLSKRFKRIPQRITFCLVLSQLLACVGVLLWSTFGSRSGWPMYIQFALFTIGNYSSRLWSALLAISLLVLQCRSFYFVLKLWPLFVCVAWGVPTVVVATLLVVDRTNISTNEKRNPNFQYSNEQVAISTFILAMCLIATGGCLALHQRYRNLSENYVSIDTESSTALSESTINLVQSSSAINNRHTSISDVGECSSTQNSTATADIAFETNDELEPLLIPQNLDEHQTMRHTVLLILLLSSMFVGLALSFWTLMMEGMSGIYVELSFLDVFLNVGQSLFVLTCFISDQITSKDLFKCN